MYLIPTDKDFVVEIAKSIARNRMHREAAETLEDLTGVKLSVHENLENTFDMVFETLWNGPTERDAHQRQAYIDDALAAISAINLKLLSTPE